MSEEQKKDVNGGSVPPENNQTDVSESLAESKESQNASSADVQDKNWKQAREIMEQQRRKIEEYEQLLKPQVEEKDELASLTDADLVTVAEVKKIVGKLAKKEAEEVYKSTRKQMEYEEVPSKYSDFQDVIKYVDDYVAENPAALDAIKTSTNPRLTAYQMVKSWYKYREDAKYKAQSQDAKKIKENLSKPASMQGNYASAPLNEINSYTKMTSQRAAEVRKLAEEYASRR